MMLHFIIYNKIEDNETMIHFHLHTKFKNEVRTQRVSQSLPSGKFTKYIATKVTAAPTSCNEEKVSLRYRYLVKPNNIRL